MPYSYRKIPEKEYDTHVFEHEGGDPVTVDELKPMEQFEILDEDRERLCICFSEVEAEGVVSHLNRGSY